MKIILNSDVASLGSKGDIVVVADGYARNYLLPKNLALIATKGGLRQAEGMQRARRERAAKEREEADSFAARISESPLRIMAKAGDEGQLFGSITTADIAQKLSETLGMEIDRRRVLLEEAIRSVGVHEFVVHVHPEVNASSTIEVVAE